MPIYKQLPRSKAKKPDEFISFFDRLYHKIYAQGPLAIAVLVIFAFVGLGTLFWRGYHRSSSEKLSARLYEVSKQDRAEQEKFYSEIQRANYYSPLGMWASLQIANMADAQDCDKVIRQLEPYVGRGEDSVLRSLIYLKMGVCLENKKEWEKAGNLYREASRDSKNIFEDWASLKLADIKKDNGDSEGAKKILEEIVQKDSKAPAVIKEEAMVQLLLDV